MPAPANAVYTVHNSLFIACGSSIYIYASCCICFFVFLFLFSFFFCELFFSHRARCVINSDLPPPRTAPKAKRPAVNNASVTLFNSQSMFLEEVWSSSGALFLVLALSSARIGHMGSGLINGSNKIFSYSSFIPLCWAYTCRGGEWSFKNSGSRKILVEFHGSRSLVF